jgi:hypothetical protein
MAENGMPNLTEPIDRKTFLRRARGLLALVGFDARTRAGPSPRTSPLPHPDARLGITAERVLPTEALGLLPYNKVVDAYDAARRYPELFDGIACGCGCTAGKHATHRSLLVCYETMQPTGCVSCQDEAQLVAKLAKQGKELAKIRLAVDKEFG